MDGAQGHKLPHLAQLPVPNNYSEHKLSLLTQPRKIFRKFFSISALRALVPRCRYANRTRFEDIRNLSSCLMRGPEIYPNGNTKRGSAYALSLQCVVHYEISQVSHDDRFAALQIDIRGLAGQSAHEAAGPIPTVSRTIFCPLSRLRLSPKSHKRTLILYHFPTPKVKEKVEESF